MAAKNGHADDNPETLDLDHELPAADNEETESASMAAVQGEELERLRQERDNLLDRVARLQAEFDNFRKRNLREQQEYRDYALADAMKQLLPILDSLDRALKTEGATAEDFRSGVDLIDRQFHQVLEKLGVEPIEATGKEFDPTLHQAIQMVDTDEVPDNHVVDELQRGYKIRERLLRPAMVRVAQNANKKS